MKSLPTDKKTLYYNEFRLSHISQSPFLGHNIRDVNPSDKNSPFNLDDSAMEIVDDVQKSAMRKKNISYINRKTLKSLSGSPEETSKIECSSIMNNSNNLNTKRANKMYCPYCEHCNSINDEKFVDNMSAIGETTNFLNKLVETITNSKYMTEQVPEANFKTLDFVEKVIDVSKPL